MKKITTLFLILLIFILNGCNVNEPQYIHFKEKPSDNYYTTEICKLLQNHTDYKLTFYDTNLCKNIELSAEDKKFILYFLNELKEDSYLPKDDERISSLEKKEPYELRITFESEEKYIFKIYSPSITSINPWDGVYKEDYINTEAVPLRYNPFEFCKYLQRRAKNNYTE